MNLDVRHRLVKGRTLGKYRLLKRLGSGGYCEVWKAKDRVEGVDVALKIPHPGRDGNRDNQTILREVKLVSRLKHPNILPVKNVEITNGFAIMAMELGQKTLDDCSRPMSVSRIANIVSQVLSALAYAHRHRVVHCDLSPSNIFLFGTNNVQLGDFGIGIHLKGRQATVDEFGTPGYVAPEQAYGRPICSSDCFAVGLILYEYITGFLPRWPYHWPFKGFETLRKKTNLAMVRFLRQALMIDPKHRFANAEEMLAAFHEALPTKIRSKIAAAPPKQRVKGWRILRREAFENRYKRVLQHFMPCSECGEPVTETMTYCPWCGSDKNRFDKVTAMTHYCPDCRKGVRPEWHYCPWCYSKGFEASEPAKGKKIRYDDHCKHCGGGITRFMRYCPWCHRKITRPWQIRPFPETCGNCQWSVDSEFWNYCPWCRQCLVEQY
ncbi:MAG: protein kinase [Sedimentisphaerales bacterium]|nr:protein kinase [Sedimentisphaerales bacterium]